MAQAGFALQQGDADFFGAAGVDGGFVDDHIAGAEQAADQQFSFWLKPCQVGPGGRNSIAYQGRHRRDGYRIRVFWPVQVHVPVTGFRRSLPE